MVVLSAIQEKKNFNRNPAQCDDVAVQTHTWKLGIDIISYFIFLLQNRECKDVIGDQHSTLQWVFAGVSFISPFWVQGMFNPLSLSSQSHSSPWFCHKVATKKITLYFGTHTFLLALQSKKAEVTTNDEVHWNIHDGCFLDGEEMAGNEGCHQGHHQCGRGISDAHSESARNTWLAGWETAKPWGMYFLCNPFLENILKKFQTSFHLLCEQAHFLKL